MSDDVGTLIRYDPDAAVRAANILEDQATEAADLYQFTSGILDTIREDGQTWKGAAATAWLAEGQQHLSDLQLACTTYQSAADSLRSWASVVSSAQATFKQSLGHSLLHPATSSQAKAAETSGNQAASDAFAATLGLRAMLDNLAGQAARLHGPGSISGPIPERALPAGAWAVGLQLRRRSFPVDHLRQRHRAEPPRRAGLSARCAERPGVAGELLGADSDPVRWHDLQRHP